MSGSMTLEQALWKFLWNLAEHLFTHVSLIVSSDYHWNTSKKKNKKFTQENKAANEGNVDAWHHIQ